VSVFWIHASNAERFRQTYAAIARDCQVPGYDDPNADALDLVKRWLERKTGDQWLMVVDNADDMQTFFGQQQLIKPPEDADSPPSVVGGNLGPYVPDCPNGAILVTTRNKQAGLKLTKGRPLIEVTGMNPEDTTMLLQEQLHGIDFTPDEASSLSSRLEHLPLALVQAAAFIQENTITINKYLNLLNKSDQHLIDLLSEEFETVGRDSEAPRTVTEAWILSFDQIQRQNVLASELLSLMSFFDRQGIPLEFLSQYCKQRKGQVAVGEVELEKAIGILKAFSFVAEEAGSQFNIHRLVHLVTWKWLVKEKEVSWFLEQALITLSQVYPYGNYETRAICSAYLPHAYSVLKFDGCGSRDGRLARATILHNKASFFRY